MGTAYMQKGEFEKARDALRRAVRISEELEDDVLTAKARARYGEVLEALGDLDGAIDSFREALNKEQRHQNIIGMAKAHRRLGSAFHRKGHFPRAQEAFEEAAALLRGAEDEVASALLATSEGELHQDAGRFDQALDSYESALVVTERRGNAVGIAHCLARRHLPRSISTVRKGSMSRSALRIDLNSLRSRAFSPPSMGCKGRPRRPLPRIARPSTSRRRWTSRSHVPEPTFGLRRRLPPMAICH
jgi:tetratricopeptide (TPR) repeat protein